MKKSSIFGLLAIAVAIAVIISVYSSSSTYGTFNEAQASGETLQVVGKLDKQKQLYYDATKDANYFSFYMRDTVGNECKVVYNSTKPEDFDHSDKIVLVGKMDKDGGFHSFAREGDSPRVELHDPMKGHTALLSRYTDADIHNLTAYLTTLK